jgi:hypothetical protein
MELYKRHFYEWWRTNASTSRTGVGEGSLSDRSSGSFVHRRRVIDGFDGMPKKDGRDLRPLPKDTASSHLKGSEE